MKYEHVLSYVSRTPWSILPEKMTEILAVLAHRAAGHTFTPQEIRARIGERSAGPSRSSSRGLAIIPIRGVIAHRMAAMDDTSGGTSCERISAMLRQVLADESVGTILLDCDTPGGSVTGVSELAAEIFAARRVKRIVAISNSLCASAGYQLASQAHEVVSIPSGTVGAIGTFAVHESLQGALEQAGIKVTLVHFGRFKVENNTFEDLTEDGLAQIQQRVDQAGEQFVKDVARGRGVTPAFVRAHYGDGRTFGATAAKAAGLIDRVGTLNDTVARIASAPADAVAARASGLAWQNQIEAELIMLSVPSDLAPARPSAATLQNRMDQERLALELALLEL